MSKAILKDNDHKFLELIIRGIKQKDPNCLVNITSIIHSHVIEIQTELKDELFYFIKELHASFGLPFQATEFIRKNLTIISFQLNDL